MATLNEGIPKIEKGSVLETLYNRLLVGFKNAQDETLPDFTSGEYVTETIGEDGSVTYVANEEKIKAYLDDYQDISTKNSAYLLASAIAGNDGNAGPTDPDAPNSGGIYVAITGDTMSGKLYTPYGFAAGDNGVKILEVYQTKEEDASERKSVVKIDGQLHLNSHGLWMNETEVMWYDNDELHLAGTTISMDGDVNIGNSLTVGGMTIDKDGIHFDDGNEYYHSGNSNKEDVDWTMHNGTVAGDLLVKGKSNLEGFVTALGGVKLGVDDAVVLDMSEAGKVSLTGDLDILVGGVKIDGEYAIHPKNLKVWSFSAPNRIFNLGDDDTTQINLQADMYDDDGEYKLVGKFGDGYFPNSFRAGHFLGNVLFETYKNDEVDSGVVVSRYLRFADMAGHGLYSDGDTLYIDSPFQYNTDGDDATQITERRQSSFRVGESESLYAPLNKKSSSVFICTSADFYVFDKPVEGKESIGISGSKTRLLDNQLFFGDAVYWQGIEDGVKHYGNAYMTGSIGSVSFSSGFAGSGWKIYQNQLTGNISATFDELTVRKKMRIYELEVQKQSVTNGSLWVSDACSGDLVEEVV